MNKPKTAPNRLAFIESGVSQREESSKATTEDAKAAKPEASKAKATKSRYTFSLPDALMDYAKTAVFHTPGLNLSSLVERALTAEIRLLERERGEEFPRRSASPKLGE